MDDEGGSFVAVRRIQQGLEHGSGCHSTSAALIPPSASLSNPRGIFYCHGCKSYDHSIHDACPKQHCDMCDNIGHNYGKCPWNLDSVPPGTISKVNLRIVCKYCHERVCYLDSLLKGQDATGYASFKYCNSCDTSGDHGFFVCPTVVEQRLCRDTNFDPHKHTSIYVENLPEQVTELDLYRHFYEANFQDIEDIEVYQDNKTGKCLGYLRFNDPLVAAEAFKWGNGTGALFGNNGNEIKCHPTKY